MYSQNNIKNTFIKFLLDSGYKTMLIKKRHTANVSVSKDEKITNDSLFDEYALESDYEKATLKVFPKGVLISLVK